MSGVPVAGSSPLARGLRGGQVADVQAGRIIPARAGFTLTAAGADGGLADHPRSRGVYPAQGWGAQRKERIIPARAGFTSRPRSGRPGSQDHPRSRGVYPTTSMPSVTRSGSSPLARGLRASPPAVIAVLGIIPARAGFTDGFDGCLWDAKDHPRSRGVYERAMVLPRGCWGSSPLARGLRDDDAGTCTGASDHPRSRGVYANDKSPWAERSGSSPLARGLHGLVTMRVTGPGIIPARAGFT